MNAMMHVAVLISLVIQIEGALQVYKHIPNCIFEYHEYLGYVF